MRKQVGEFHSHISLGLARFYPYTQCRNEVTIESQTDLFADFTVGDNHYDETIYFRLYT